MRSTASILATVGGVLFLVLPVAFSNGTVSITYPPWPSYTCHPYVCYLPLFYRTLMPDAMIPFWASIGAVGILLGFFILILGPRPRVGLALGLTLSLGTIALLFWTVTSQILRTFIVTPAGFLLFPEASVVAMAGATLLYGYEFLRRGREIITAITS